MLEERFPALVEDQPEIVARHYVLGGHPERAAHFWLRGGQRSLRRNAHVEAAAHLRSALAAVGELPESNAKALAELDVQIALGTALVAARGYASPDVETAWRRAQQLCAVEGAQHHGQPWHCVHRAEPACGWRPAPSTRARCAPSAC